MKTCVRTYEKKVRDIIQKFSRRTRQDQEVVHKKNHKVSTDVEDLEDDLSEKSKLSELSDHSDILFEDEVLR